jgi:hypothetical protein
MRLLRRRFIVLMGALAAAGAALLAGPRRYIKRFLLEVEVLITPKDRVSPSPDQVSEIFLARHGSPQENVAKVMEMMGGIERFVGANDIVILKPNAQWWNQGRTNLAAMKGFIDLVLGIPGFSGEIIVAENHHFMDASLPEGEKDNLRGWTELGEINNDIDGVPHTLNSLVELFQKKGHPNVTKSHWRDGGPKADVWGNGQNGGVVSSPAGGDGYVWTDEEWELKGLWGLRNWKVKMTYPIFTSTYSGITIDFKNGAFLRDEESGGHYLEDRPLRFINFSVLNTHGADTGTTSAIKNYMGVTDLSCGWWGLEPEGYANVHACGADYYPFAKAGPLGHFLKTIRVADLNIVTAEWVGWGSRTDVTQATRMKTILAGTDPVALDYYGAKHLVYPLSRHAEYHDPDNPRSAVARFLRLAQEAWGQGVADEGRMRVQEHSFTDG